MASTRRITVLQHISHEAPECEKWQVNDVANISTKLLMSSFYASVDNKLYVSIYSAERQEVQKRHYIEVSTQREPHSVLMNKDGSTLVVCVGMNIQFYKASNGKLQKTVILETEPSCICRGKEGLLVATDNSRTIQSFNFEGLQTKQVVLEGLDQSDHPSDMTMVGDRIYLCTQKTGQALSYDQHGVKLSAFKSNDEQNSVANSIAVHMEKRLVFILWNKCNVLVYSHLFNESLFSVDTTCSNKVRLNDDYMMILKVPANNEILIYDVETIIDFAMLKEEFLATLEEKVRDEILTDRKPHDPRQNQTSTKSSDSSVFKRIPSTRKKKKRQQQKELLKLFDELQIKYANDNGKQETTGGLAEQVQTEAPTDFTMLKEDYLATLGKKKPQQQNLLKMFDELQRKYENYNANIETKERQLHESKTAESALEKSEKTKLAPEKEIEEKDTRLLEEERKIEGQKTSLLSSSEMMKEQEDMSTELKGQQKILKEILEQVKEKSTREERSSDQTENARKTLQQTKAMLEKEKEYLTKLLAAGERNETEMKKSLEKATTTCENLQKAYEILQKEKEDLSDQLSTEKSNTEIQIASFSKVVTNLKKVEEMNTKLEGEVTELKKRLLVEEKTTKEMQTSSLILNERIKDLEDVRTELESQQKKLKDMLDQEKDKVTRAEGSRIQATTTCEKLQKAYEILQKEKEDLSEQLSTEKINTEIQIASFPKMTSHAWSGSEKMAQRKDEDSYLCDETQSVITESTDSGRSSMHAGLEYQDPFILDGRQLNTELKVAVTVASKGANMHIPDTGVELDIPTGATQGKVLIEMIILPFDKLDAPVSTFSCNSSVAVELLPNRMEFNKPVRLILPHCLKLTKNYKKTKNQVQVYVSHHVTGPPIWEEDSNAKYVLDETNCVIFLKSFCWVKYEVNNKIVEAKRIKVYTAGKHLKHSQDSLAEVEVGYHCDLPTARENLSVNDNMFVYQSKPFIFVKQGNLPLEILLTKTVPKQWKYITPEDNPKVISFKCVADSKEKTCPFVIEKSEPTDRMPFCMFKVQQGNEDMEIYIRFYE